MILMTVETHQSCKKGVVLSLLKKRNRKELKLQAAMEGTSPGSPPTGGFRRTGNGEQYAFKKVNIEEYLKVIYMYQTCCQLVVQRP